MNFNINKKTRVLIVIMGTLFISAFVFAHLYYKYQNESIDPRIVEANILYQKFNDYASIKDYNAIFLLMDSIENIYAEIPHYNNSYEIGVLYNNRAASYISMALDSNVNNKLIKDSLLDNANININKSIEIYTQWLKKWETLSENEIENFIKKDFNKNDTVFKNKNIKRFINKRVKQIKESQIETPRRLSVSYTNLGIIYRHKELYDEAAEKYIKALELWPDNLSAENNLSVLLGKPQKKRSLLRKIFPKDRTE